MQPGKPPSAFFQALRMTRPAHGSFEISMDSFRNITVCECVISKMICFRRSSRRHAIISRLRLTSGKTAPETKLIVTATPADIADAHRLLNQKAVVYRSCCGTLISTPVNANPMAAGTFQKTGKGTHKANR